MNFLTKRKIRNLLEKVIFPVLFSEVWGSAAGWCSFRSKAYEERDDCSKYSRGGAVGSIIVSVGSSFRPV